MTYEVLYTRNFEKNLKKLVKKYPSLKSEVLGLIESLENNPEQGKSLGNACYKIRLALLQSVLGNQEVRGW